MQPMKENNQIWQSSRADMNVIMGDGKVSSSTELLLDNLLRTVSILVSMDLVDLALSFKL